MIELKFKLPVFKAGVNFTVKMGIKPWAVVERGDGMLKLLGPRGKLLGTAEVVIATLGPMRKIQPVVFEHHQNPDCSTLEGLEMTLREEYKFKKSEKILDKTVTCIGFLLVKDDV